MESDKIARRWEVRVTYKDGTHEKYPNTSGAKVENGFLVLLDLDEKEWVYINVDFIVKYVVKEVE